MPGSQSPQSWPQDVGIVAMEIYFPSQYVDQTELEVFDGISAGKYTIGLGQSKMGFCSDCEDINSLCLTATQNLLKRNNINPTNIGRLEVGTETIIDKSKSVKSALMQLFHESGNTDVEGIDTTNACYGGTNALFNSLNWVESSSWDGRLALAVCGDIAVYATGPARCTGGAGAVAMLVGPNAAAVVERGVRSSHMEHVYDFYKPDLSSEYPVVDGHLSIKCYLNALDICYERYRRKAHATFQTGTTFSMDDADAFCFHSPFCKLVQKSIARLMFNDFLSNPDDEKYSTLTDFRDVKLEDSYFNRDVEKAFMKATEKEFTEKTKPALIAPNQVGNMYTASVYSSLCSYISGRNASELSGKRALLFSYGSGLASSMFSIRFADDRSQGSPLDKLSQSLFHLQDRLDSRRKIEPSKFSDSMKLREDTHHLAPYKPVGSTEDLFPGTWYLTAVDDKHRRLYSVVEQAIVNAGAESPIIEPAVKKRVLGENSNEVSEEQVQA